MKVKADTIARTTILVIALINQILAILGKERIAILDDDVYQIVSICLTVASSVIAWWKNNSFTKSAIKADLVLEELRNEDTEAVG